MVLFRIGISIADATPKPTTPATPYLINWRLDVDVDDVDISKTSIASDAKSQFKRV